jgi:hypothetical protein
VIHLKRVALEIKDIGLYNLILEDVQKIVGKTKVTEDEIIEVLKTHPEILEEYKQLNVEYNLSNIHIRDIDIDSLDEDCKKEAKEINENLKLLRELEPYTLDFEQSSTLVIIFSVEFFVLFSVQYFIVLLNLKDLQWYIYGFFALSIAAAWKYANKERKKFAVNKEAFEKIYEETLEKLSKLEERGCIKKEDLIIEECEDHVRK